MEKGKRKVSEVFSPAVRKLTLVELRAAFLELSWVESARLGSHMSPEGDHSHPVELDHLSVATWGGETFTISEMEGTSFAFDVKDVTPLTMEKIRGVFKGFNWG